MPLNLSVPVAVDPRVDPDAVDNEYKNAKIIKLDWTPNSNSGKIYREYGNISGSNWIKGKSARKNETLISDSPLLDANGDPIPDSEGQYTAMVSAKHEDAAAILSQLDTVLGWASNGHTMNQAQVDEIQAIRDAVDNMHSTYTDVKIKTYQYLLDNNFESGTIV